MELVYRRLEELPRLSWCVEVKRDRNWVEVLHGAAVETAATWFCEGAWDGPYSAGAFESALFMGSGGKATREGLLLAAPNHTLERIYLLTVGDCVLASNSLPFLLARAQDDLDPRCLTYAARLTSIVEGLKECIRDLPTRDGRRMRLVYHANLLITPDLRVVERPKRPTRDFKDFADYTGFLERTVAAILRNASDPARRHAYAPIATVSTGYDSPAAALLAKRAGCAEALSFRLARPRPGAPGVMEDSGTRIADRLGLKVTCFDRLDYLRDPESEAENEGYPLVFAAWRDKLQGRILVTGYYGDRVWDRNPIRVGSDIPRGGGACFAEFRMRTGYLHLPVPYLGCTSLSSIHRISNSAEMRPWTLLRAYDRPIPRRLLEQAGVPRDHFGMAKKAVEIVSSIEGTGVLRPESVVDFANFCARRWGPWMALKNLGLAVPRYVHKLNKRLSAHVAITLKIKLGMTVRLPSIVPTQLRRLSYGPSGRENLRFHWSVSKLLPRYQAAAGIARLSAVETPSQSAVAPIGQPFPELGSSAAQ
jgi:hypothetical protein